MIASASRNIMDAGKLYFYIAERGISKEEVEFRYNLQNLNYEKNIKDILKKLNYSSDAFLFRVLDMGYIENALRNSSRYRNADDKGKKQILSGKNFYERKQLNIFDQNTAPAIYNLLSNSVHCFYLGLSNNSINHSIAFNSYIDVTMLLIIAVETAIIYTSHILNDYLSLRKIFNRDISKEEKNKIKSLMNTEYLMAYIDIQREKFNQD